MPSACVTKVVSFKTPPMSATAKSRGIALSNSEASSPVRRALSIAANWLAIAVEKMTKENCQLGAGRFTIEDLRLTI
jgi:hypothetical protein